MPGVGGSSSRSEGKKREIKKEKWKRGNERRKERKERESGEKRKRGEREKEIWGVCSGFEIRIYSIFYFLKKVSFLIILRQNFNF